MDICLNSPMLYSKIEQAQNRRSKTMGSIIAAFLIGFIMGIALIVGIALHYGKEDESNER